MDQAEAPVKHGATAGIIASVLAILGIFSYGLVFVPPALIFMLFGFLLAIVGRSGTGIGYNLLAVILTLIAILVSPSLLTIIGLQGLAMSL
ncbi:hypothetical protein [Amphritea balenae]|uniref:Uncharacterized protein n=1 Tax=Amphritea balenae TaxID=452629 RepID=A0A3P1SWZ3_9GAMM|nr:hypothetical protein [Amphritea balenae]RRD01767.1 hypothetical protein EHS89_04275 [Amphritea balenae]GGK54193.1 hypothetical protein GCM10007941_00310 [Amphritea balenae]